MIPKVSWPDGKAFAFTVFDDPDGQTLADGQAVYALLADLGFRTTKAVWPMPGDRPPIERGETCAEPEYRAWSQRVQRQRFEIGYHNASSRTSDREATLRGLEAFADYFGAYPTAMANHYNCSEGIYWGDARVTGIHRVFYDALTRGRNRARFFGHVDGHPYFWGDLCRRHIKYVRNFVFGDINTLKACPYMPYHDPSRPYVNYWYAASEGDHAPAFVERISEANQDRLEEEGGACIMYTHFGHGYVNGGGLDGRFVSLMRRLSRKNGWFVPVSTLLDYLLGQRQGAVLTPPQRRELERRWLWHKVHFGTA
jgi:hypothetical protein